MKTRDGSGFRREEAVECPHAPKDIRSRPRLEFVAIDPMDARQERLAPAGKPCHASGCVSRRFLDPRRIEIDVVGMPEDVSEALEFADGPARITGHEGGPNAAKFETHTLDELLVVSA